MNNIEIKSYAKINLILNVLSKREDGYHNIESIMQSISLADKVTISERMNGIKIDCDHHKVPTDLKSLAYRTAGKILDKCKLKKGIDIKINKKIPLGSGLAGGSTNSATILMGINKVYHLGLTNDKLREIGGELGMDIPFFIQNGTALAYHKGEKVTHFASVKPPLWLIILNPGFEVSTQWAYQNLKFGKGNVQKDRINKMILALKTGKPEEIAKNLYNSFEKMVIRKFPEIGEIKETLIKEGALGVLMSGSGPTIFGIAKNKDAALKIYSNIKSRYNLIWVVHTV